MGTVASAEFRASCSESIGLVRVPPLPCAREHTHTHTPHARLALHALHSERCMLYTSLLCLTAPLLSNSFQRTNRNLGNDAPPVASVRNNRIRSAAPSDRRIGLQSYPGAPKGRGLQPCSSHSRGAVPGAEPREWHGSSNSCADLPTEFASNTYRDWTDALRGAAPLRGRSLVAGNPSRLSAFVALV